MNRIVEYKIMKHLISESLEMDVSYHIKNGWQPFGAPFFCDDGQRLYQALVKYEQPR